MDPPSPLLPMHESQALHALSPERMNCARPSRSRKMAATDPLATENPPLAQSPTRKGNWADFSFGGRSPPKELGPGLPQSPSLPEITALRSHVRNNSDVQGLVKRFEHLDVRDRDAESAERRKKHEAELRRAQMAREEAENDVKRLREETRRLKKEGDESHERERRVGKRLEIVMEECANSKETYASQVAVYEKEVRKSRKEAFKSSSAVLKLQEELKSTRSTLRVAQSNLDLEKRKVQQKEQETFSAQYLFVALQEELDNLKAKMKVVEEEREALKTSLKEEEVARIAAEGMIALPAPNHDDDDDLLSSPKRRSPYKRPRSPLSDDKENMGVVTKKALEAKQLAGELSMERRRRQQAQELAEFLQLECQFGCCSCRSTKEFSHGQDSSPRSNLAKAINMVHDDVAAISTASSTESDRVVPDPDKMLVEEPAMDAPNDGHSETANVESDMMNTHKIDPQEDLDHSMTVSEEPLPEPATQEHGWMIPAEQPQAPHSTPVDPMMDAEEDSLRATNVPLQPSNPDPTPHAHQTTPFRHQTSMRTITTTTMIPMHFTPSKPAVPFAIDDDAEHIPPTADVLPSGVAPVATFDREAALAAIAYRRGRAKSMANGNMTPRKQMMEGVNLKERRDISAPALGQKTIPANFAKDAASVGRAAGRTFV